MKGFAFKNISSAEFGLDVLHISRPLFPPLSRSLLKVQGHDGTFDFRNNYFDDVDVEVEVLLYASSREQMREQATRIGKWLWTDRYEPLWFDDEPEHEYYARVYDLQSFDAKRRLGRATLTFSCQPFRFERQYQQVEAVSDGYAQFTAHNKGTAPTPCIITITNTGGTDLTNITILRKAAI